MVANAMRSQAYEKYDDWTSIRKRTITMSTSRLNLQANSTSRRLPHYSQLNLFCNIYGLKPTKDSVVLYSHIYLSAVIIDQFFQV